MKEEGIPRKNVKDISFDTPKVAAIERRMKPVRSKAETREDENPTALPTKNMVMIEINIGNRPLQGTKLLVRIAIKRSLGESMILQPTTPAALQPKPIHIVKACFPQVLHL